MHNKSKYVMESLYEISNRPLNDEVLYSEIPISKIKFEDINTHIKNDIDFARYMNISEINSNGYRCEEFKKNHNKKHIVFTGCSYTFGDGALYNESWAKLTYDLINKKEQCSGYFNLGIPGSSIFTQITDLFKYFKTYGNPDVVFLNIPDFQRMFVFNKILNNIQDGRYNQESLPILRLLGYQYYLVLDQYCKQNNIKLFSFSWTYFGGRGFESFVNIINSFDTFYTHTLKQITEYVYMYKKKYPNDKFAEIGRDNAHWGNAYHNFWSYFIYNKYKENL
jgi:hypothetical protein